jgi:hypothetical protein
MVDQKGNYPAGRKQNSIKMRTANTTKLALLSSISIGSYFI